MDGMKDILGVWIVEHESSKFWLNVMCKLILTVSPQAIGPGRKKARPNRVRALTISDSAVILRIERALPVSGWPPARACLINCFGCRGEFFRQMAQRPQGILCGFPRIFGTYDGKRRCPDAKSDLSNKPLVTKSNRRFARRLLLFIGRDNDSRS